MSSLIFLCELSALISMVVALIFFLRYERKLKALLMGAITGFAMVILFSFIGYGTILVLNKAYPHGPSSTLVSLAILTTYTVPIIVLIRGKEVVKRIIYRAIYQPLYSRSNKYRPKYVNHEKTS